MSDVNEVAFTTIRHGEEDGSVTIVEQGHPVTGILPVDVVDELRNQGLVGVAQLTPEQAQEDAAERAALQTRVAELEAQLAAAQKSAPTK